MTPRRTPGLQLPDGVRRERIEPLWARVDRNRRKLAFIITAYLLSIAVSAAAVVAVAALIIGVLSMRAVFLPAEYLSFVRDLVLGTALVALVGGAAWVAYSLLGSERRLLGRLGAVLTPTGDCVPAKLALKDMSIAAGYDHAPALWVITDCTRVNAFAVGRTEQTSVVGVTQGFVDRLDPEEQRAVFANLMARLRNGDVRVATAVSALVGPLWRMRDADFRRGDGTLFESSEEDGSGAGSGRRLRLKRSAAIEGAAVFVLYGFVIVVSEVLLHGHQKASLLTAEKADAEGMLLLKDPSVMLQTLEKVLDANNTVPTAGEAYSDLFYCWAGFGYAPEDDPEFQRIARLREVLGIEGLVDSPRLGTFEEVLPPAAPRLEEQGSSGQ